MRVLPEYLASAVHLHTYIPMDYIDRVARRNLYETANSASRRHEDPIEKCA